MTMNGNGHYERPNVARSEKLHPIYEKFGAWQTLESLKSEPGYLQQVLAPLYDSGVYILGTFQDLIEKYQGYEKSDEVKELRPEIVAAKKSAILREAREAAYSFYKKEIGKAQLGVDAAMNHVLGLTAPIDEGISAPSHEIKRSAREQTIWQYLLSLPPQERSDAIRGNEERLRACANSPVPIIGEETLEKLRREFAFDTRPDLIAMLDDATHIRDSVRRRSGNVNAAMVKMLIAKGIVDPMIEPNPRIHFETFGARSPWEKFQIDKRILEYDHRQEQLARRLERLAKDSGEPIFDTESVGRKLKDVDRKKARDVSKSRPHPMPRAGR